jgi:hypothetical protein
VKTVTDVLKTLQDFSRHLKSFDCRDEASRSVYDGRLGVYEKLQAYVCGVNLGSINGDFRDLFGFNAEDLPRVISNYPRV